MKIELELDDKEAKLFLLARTKDGNVEKYSSEAVEEATKQALEGFFYESIANFEIYRATEIKKAQMVEWIKSKVSINAGQISESNN